MIDATCHDRILTLTLNAPERHNALGVADMDALRAALSGTSEARVIVLTGTGRSFCAGASLADVSGDADWSDNPLTALCDALEEVPVPTIARLNGGAYGGGMELALACDFRIGVRGMKAFAPPARLGIHYEPAGIRRAIDRLGAQTARRIFLLAERFDGDALLACGFLDDLVAPDALDETVGTMAATLAGHAPLAVQGMKQTIVELSRGTLDRAAARARIETCFASADHAEGLRAQSEKRPPVFRGA